MKVAVTGATGYTGYHAVQVLLAAGHHVVAVGRAPALATRLPTHPCLRYVQANVLGPTAPGHEASYEALGRPKVLLHLAWEEGFNHQAPSHLESLPLHLRFLTGLVAQGLPHVAVVGSMHEVGYWEGMVNADTPTNPSSPYGIAKNALRQALQSHCAQQGVVFQWLRCFYPYGDDTRCRGSIFSKILQWEAEGRTHFPFTDGLNQYDYLPVGELAHQLVVALSQTHVNGLIHCCSGQPTAIKERVEAFLQEHELRIRPQYGAFPPRPYDSPLIYGDALVIHTLLKEAQATHGS